MYNVLIVDDVKELCDTLADLLKNYFSDQIGVINRAYSYEEAFDLVNEVDFDILFLDIELEAGKTGFQLLDQIQNKAFHLIVTTAYSHYALNAIKCSALDFLLKPIGREDLTNVFDKVSQKDTLKHLLEMQLNVLRNNLNEVAESKKLVLRTHEAIHVVNVNTIIRCEADANYTIFYIDSGEKIIVSKSLKEYEDFLSKLNFFRSHKSHLINVDFMKRYEKRDGGYLLMKDGAHVPVSVRRREQLFQVIESL